MYLNYFGLTRLPFSIAPDPDLLYLSPAHHEALAHLNYALTSHGGLICLTGEVGMGKTTLCRAFIEQAPDYVDIAYIFNPMLSAPELLQSICNELEIPCEADRHGRELSNKQLIDLLYASLIERHSNGRKVICIIDEAQSMPAPLLEQIRLLTNLETSRDKLLTLILVGQPELQETLSQHNIRQLDQRITARFHLPAMTKQQLGPYLQHRLNQAGCKHSLFDASAISAIWQGSQGIPRLINSIADRALLGAYATGQKTVNKAIAKQAISEVVAPKKRKKKSSSAFIPKFLLSMAFIAVTFLAIFAIKDSSLMSVFKDENHYQKLAVAYKLDANEEFGSCLNIEQASNLQCLVLDWSLTDLKRLRRDIAAYDGAEWQIRQPQELLMKPKQALILWQPVEGFTKAIKPGESNSLISWVRLQLKNEGEQAGEDAWQIISPTGSYSSGFDQYYDPMLANKIASFQQRVGLKSDRIIGLKTLLAIQDYTDQDGLEMNSDASSTSIEKAL
jgi:general secretion pathway protein A